MRWNVAKCWITILGYVQHTNSAPSFVALLQTYHDLVLLFVEVHGHKQVLLTHSVTLTALNKCSNILYLHDVHVETTVLEFTVCTQW